MRINIQQEDSDSWDFNHNSPPANLGDDTNPIQYRKPTAPTETAPSRSPIKHRARWASDHKISGTPQNNGGGIIQHAYGDPRANIGVPILPTTHRCTKNQPKIQRRHHDTQTLEIGHYTKPINHQHYRKKYPPGSNNLVGFARVRMEGTPNRGDRYGELLNPQPT